MVHSKRRNGGAIMIGLNRRRTMGGGSAPLPYDAEIEYLLGNSQSGDDNYIDTGITPNGNDTLRIEIAYSVNNVARRVVVGNYLSNTGTYKGISIENYVSSSQNRLRLYAHSGTTATNNVDTVSIPTDTKINLNAIVDFVNKKWDASYKIGSSTYSYAPTLSSADISSMNLSLRLFMDYRAAFQRPTILHPLKIYMCKLYLDDVKVRDFIPVRKGQVGYMYDKVSGELFGNSGTGDFVLGNDK